MIREKSSMKPLVSVLCVCYNQEKYIGRALDSFLTQKLDEKIEIVVHDDASTDRTLEVLEEYRREHPGVITILSEKENQFSKGNLAFMENVYETAKGEFLAWCEGDDYWTDDMKLQKQIDYMRKHTDATVCFHPVEVIYEDDATKKEIFPLTESDRVFTFQDLLGVNFIQTNSVMYRRLADYKHAVPEDIVPLDWYMHILHASKSPNEPLGFISEPMAVYRKHSHGIWQRDKKNEHEFWLKRASPHMRMHEKVVKLFDGKPEYQALAWSSAFRTASAAYSVLADNGDYTNAGKIMQEFPEYTIRLVADYNKRFNEQAHRLDDANNELYRLGVDSAIMKETIINLRAENAHVYHMLGRTLEHKLKQGVHFIKRSLKKRR